MSGNENETVQPIVGHRAAYGSTARLRALGPEAREERAIAEGRS